MRFFAGGSKQEVIDRQSAPYQSAEAKVAEL